MKNAFKLALAASAAVAALSASAQSYDYGRHDGNDRIDASQIDARQARQQERIERGLQRGQLTRSEVQMLRREQRRIAVAEERAKADGHLSRHEVRELTAMLDRADEHIRRLRHDSDERVSMR
jgi:hypothetical protein